ncbi:hypothetical protein [Lysinibacillus fusiformis]|uniref:hypothetical protein n=1 Tax=Lysinibacillus fusiformis TaxID=28031 RepID=UPI00050816B0|nr:hypothetical protein [Lysinibacillus fusiformis]KGA83627.1 hypothetical protein KQ41_06145 [Lysinibacillus fusiformis]UXJ71312.1 hypothetical protein N5069_24045 [Lysinibacillus fusiformis]
MKKRVIDFQTAKEAKQVEAFINQGIQMFLNEMLPFMTQVEFTMLRDLFSKNASDEELAFTLAKIKTRIDIENNIIKGEI